MIQLLLLVVEWGFYPWETKTHCKGWQVNTVSTLIWASPLKGVGVIVIVPHRGTV